MKSEAVRGFFDGCGGWETEEARQRAEADVELNAAAAYFQHRDRLFGQMRPAVDGKLMTGDALVLVGEVMHAAPGTAAGESRLVAFTTAYEEGREARRSRGRFEAPLILVSLPP